MFYKSVIALGNEAPKSLEGQVIYGRKQGRKIGFPTANIQCVDETITNGVYGGVAYVEGEKKLALLNIGVKPTFEEGLEKTFEVHILNFSKIIYGKTLKFEVLFRIRDEKKYSSIIALTTQINRDIEIAKSRYKQLIIQKRNSAQGKLIHSHYLNLPDLQFYKWCNRQFEINRGIFNTIDQWLYNQQLKDIYSRRIHILAFLQHMRENEDKYDSKNRLRFGSGGLVNSLKKFMIAISKGEL